VAETRKDIMDARTYKRKGTKMLLLRGNDKKM